MTDRAEGTYTIRKLADDEREALFDGYRRWSPDGGNIVEAFRWRERFESPAPMNDPWGVWLDGTFSGTTSSTPAFLHHRGRELNAVWQVDAMVDEACRGRQLGTRLMEASWEGYDLILQKGISTPMYGLTRRFLGYVDGPNTNLLIAVLRPFKADAGWGKRLLYFLLYLLTGFGRARARLASGRAREITVERIDRFDDRYDALAETAIRRDVLQPRKDGRYLNWRYRDCRLRDYVVLQASDARGLRGALVYRYDREPVRRAWLVDLIAPVDDAACAEALVAEALRRLRRDHGVHNALVFATSSRMRRRLKRQGFVERRLSPRFTYRVVANPHDIDFASCEWNLWHGDSDSDLFG